MNDTDAAVVPIWTLSTSPQSIQVPAVADHGTLTPERLTQLRSALATFASAPLVTLEAYPLAKKRDRSAGLPLDAVSPLAQELSRLVAANAKSVPAVAQVAQSSETLYRMVVPAKVAAEVGMDFPRFGGHVRLGQFFFVLDVDGSLPLVLELMGREEAERRVATPQVVGP